MFDISNKYSFYRSEQYDNLKTYYYSIFTTFIEVRCFQRSLWIGIASLFMLDFFSSTLAKLKVIVLKVLAGSSISLSYILVGPGYLTFAWANYLCDFFSIFTMLIHQALQICAELLDFFDPLLLTLWDKSLPINLANISKTFRSQQKPYIRFVEWLLTYLEPGSCLFIGMIKVE